MEPDAGTELPALAGAGEVEPLGLAEPEVVEGEVLGAGLEVFGAGLAGALGAGLGELGAEGGLVGTLWELPERGTLVLEPLAQLAGKLPAGRQMIASGGVLAVAGQPVRRSKGRYFNEPLTC